MFFVIATAPGKLILTGEYAVLDGAPALVIAVNRRVIARRGGVSSSPFLLAVAREVAQRYGADSAGARAALEIAVDSSSFYADHQKLGLGSSAAVTVAAVALAIAQQHGTIDGHRDEILTLSLAAHANAQGEKGARGSGADIAAAVYGGTIAFTMAPHDTRLAAAIELLRDTTSEHLASMVTDELADARDVDRPHRGSDGREDSSRIRDEERLPVITRYRWPDGVVLVPFFTGSSADTATLVSQIARARTAEPAAVEAALAAIAEASKAACASLVAPAAGALLAALRHAAAATDQLATATGADLVPACVRAAREAMQALGGTAKTTGAGGGDVAIAVIPASADVTTATRLLIEAGCQPLQLTVDDTGVDTRSAAQ